jgi:hypothetical protein
MMRQPPRLLLVMQTPDASTGRCGRKLRERGYALDCCYPLAGPAAAGRDGRLHRGYRYGANAFGVQFHPEVNQRIRSCKFSCDRL